jgi:hypothetical protein
MNKFLSTLFATISVFISFSQITINSQQTIGGTGGELMESYFYDSQGNKYIIGASNSDISFDKTENSRGDNDIWMVKFDVNNNILWDKTIGGSDYDGIVNAIIVNDTVFIASSSYSNISGEKAMNNFGLGDIWMLALDLDGNILWQESYGGDAEEGFPELVSLPNGNLLLSCSSKSGHSGNKVTDNIGFADLWLVELNPLDGVIIQQESVGSIKEEYLISTIISPQQTIILMGTSREGVSGDKTDAGYGSDDIWIVELDLNFNVLMDKCFGGDGAENTNFGSITFDDEYYYIAGTSSSGASGNKTEPLFSNGGWIPYSDFWLIKTDHSFNVVWDKVYGGHQEDNCVSVTLNDWNKLVLSGASKSGVSGNKTEASYGDYDAWIVIVDKNNGDIIGQDSFGGSGSEGGLIFPSTTNPQELKMLASSSSAPSGNKTTPHYGDGDAWVLSLDASDFLNVQTIVDEISVVAHPNPFNEELHLIFESLKEEVVLKFYSADGKLLSSSVLEVGANSFDCRFEYASSVIYYEMQGETIFSRGKVVKM